MLDEEQKGKCLELLIHECAIYAFEWQYADKISLLHTLRW